ncbi:MAG: hypothetical protein AAB628_02515 [Patescibacteria group bacterium]
MDNIFEHYRKTGYLHHAHVIEGEREVLIKVLSGLLAKHMGITAKGNPDVTVEHYESFGIYEARKLSARQSRHGFGEISKDGSVAKKIFIVSTNSFTREAQNALLKTFEEPTEGTHFFIIVPHHDVILKTLRSRVVMVKPEATQFHDETKDIAVKFLDSTLEERFTLIKKLTETKKGETVDREKIRRILDHVERILYTRTAGKSAGEIFREIYQTKTYLADRGSSPKMLLDNIAIALVV